MKADAGKDFCFTLKRCCTAVILKPEEELFQFLPARYTAAVRLNGLFPLKFSDSNRRSGNFPNMIRMFSRRLIGIIEDLRNRAMKAAEDPESAEQKVLISYLYDPYRFYKYGCALEFNPEEDIYVINDHDPIIAGWGLKDKSADSAAGQIFYKVHSCEPEQKMDADRAESETVQPEKKTFYEEKTATAAFSSFSEDNEQSIPENSTTDETVRIRFQAFRQV